MDFMKSVLLVLHEIGAGRMPMF